MSGYIERPARASRSMLEAAASTVANALPSHFEVTIEDQSIRVGYRPVIVPSNDDQTGTDAA